jgi:serine/threonine protein kinase
VEVPPTARLVMELRSQLPMRQYHLAERLGEGACGAVRTVYDDDGQVFALKCFEPEEDDGTLASETIREISVLRCMRGKLGHPNVLAMLDIMEVDEDVGMVMPKLSMNLTDAIEGKAVGKNKLKVTHGLLSAVAYVHAQGFMHRDIKGDNVMLTDEMVPILIDFSLTKSLGADGVATEGQGTHTGNIGTAKYIAPEVYQSEEYGVRADIWSAGVVLLEMFMDSVMSCERDKAAYAMIESLKAQRPAAKPVTGLLRAMLATDPEQRPTASQALVMEPLASKFGTAAPTTARTILAVAEAGVKTVREAGAVEAPLRACCRRLRPPQRAIPRISHPLMPGGRQIAAQEEGWG